jgi:hypothetical protein
VEYNGSATVPSAAGTYAITASFTPTDTADYASLTGASAGNFVIGKGAVTLSVTNSPVTYTGSAQAALVTGSVPGSASNVEYNGSATVPSAAGTYAITASFTPTDTADYASLTGASAGNFVIGVATPTITFTVPNHTYGDPPFTVTATSNSTGAITYSVVSGPATVAGSTVTLTGAGTVVLEASQAATSNYSAGTQMATFTVASASATLNFAAIPPQTYGNAPFTVSASSSSTGAITYSIVSGSAMVNGATGLVTLTGAGTLTIGASQAATINYAAGTAQTTIAVAREASQVVVSATASSINPGQSVTLTATVTPAVLGTPTGTVTFFEGTTQIGSPVPVTGGMAQLSTTTLSSGSDSISATYSGDANFLTSSGSLSGGISVAPLTFTMTASPASQTGPSGTSFAYLLALTPSYGLYPGTVTFSASGLPAGATATFSPNSLAANAGAQSVGMAITTAASTASVQTLRVGRGMAPLALALLLLPLAGTRRMRRQGRRFGRFLCLLLLAMAGVAATTALTGCGSSGYKQTATAKNYTITVTATSGNIQQTSTVDLTLQ